MGADLRNNGLFVQTGNPATVDETSANLWIAGQLGHVMAVVDTTSPALPRLFQYVTRSSSDAVTVVAGMTALWKDYDDFVVTADSSDSFDGAGGNHVAGTFVGTTPASSNYGYVQVGGIVSQLFKITPAVTPTTGGLPVIAGTDGQADTYAGWTNSSTGNTIASKPYAKTIAAGNSTASTSSSVILLVDRVGW